MKSKKYFSALALLLTIAPAFGMNNNPNNNQNQNALHGAAANGNAAIVNLLIGNGANINANQNLLNLAVNGNLNQLMVVFNEKHDAINDFVKNPLDGLNNKDFTKTGLLKELYWDLIEVSFELMELKPTTEFTSAAPYLASLLNFSSFGYLGSNQSSESEQKNKNFGMQKYDQFLPYQQLCRIHYVYNNADEADDLGKLIKKMDFSDCNENKGLTTKQQDILIKIVGALRAQTEVATPKLKKLENVNFSFEESE